MQYIKKITEKHKPCSSRFQDITTSNDQLQWVTFHIHILELKGYNPPFEVSKVACTYRNFHIIIATKQTIEYWIRRPQFHLSYVNNVSDTMACLKTTFLMWYQAICGEFCSYRQLPTHLTRLGRHQWTPCFVLMGPYWSLICIEWRHTHADRLNRSDH